MTDGDQQETRWDGDPATQQPNGGPPPGPAPKKTVPRALFNVVLALFVVSLLVIASLVVLKPFKGSSSADSKLGLGTSATGSSAPAAASSSPAASAPASASAAPSGSASAPSGAASSAPPPSSGTDLFTQTPVQSSADALQDGAVQIGTTAYPDSVRFTCDTGDGSPTQLIYDTAGFGFLNATLGVPSDATNAAGNTMNVTFFKDGTTDQLGKTLTIALDSSVQLHLNLDGASQLSIACQANNASSQAVTMDGAFGNAVLIPS